MYDGVNGIQTWADDVTITNNEIYDMGVTYGQTRVVGSRTYKNSGIVVGSNWETGNFDPANVYAEDNSIRDNYWGMFHSDEMTNEVAAIFNYWGEYDGPEDLIGSEEATTSDCFSVATMVNAVAEAFSAEGLGNGVSERVSYCPWITDECCLHRGNVDRIFGPAGPIDVADITYLVAYLFSGGSAPPCIEEGNVDAIVGPAGPIDVADLTYLVAYVFSGGPPPPPCP